MPRTFLALLLVCGIAGISVPVSAQEPDPAAVDAARVDFAEGQGHFRSKRWNEALKAFERSVAQVPSPNALLMIGRCLRELGRGPEAATAFKEAESEARRRVKNGESKYADTADAAQSEGKAVSAGLGTLKIHVAHASGAALYVDRKPVTLSPSGDATVLHDPGTVQVVVRGGDGVEQRQTATVVTQSTAEMEFVVAETKTAAPALATKPVPPNTEPTQTQGSRFPGWFWPAAIAAGGVTLGGAGVGFGFGAVSKSQYDELATSCGKSGCGSDQEIAQRDTGKRNQTIANVGFGVSIVGLVATGIILVIGLTSDHRSGKL